MPGDIVIRNSICFFIADVLHIALKTAFSGKLQTKNFKLKLSNCILQVFLSALLVHLIHSSDQ